VACREATRGKRRSQRSRPSIKTADHRAAQVPGWLVGRLRLGVGHASTVRPDPSTLGAVGERGSRHESCWQLVPGSGGPQPFGPAPVRGDRGLCSRLYMRAMAGSNVARCCCQVSSSSPAMGASTRWRSDRSGTAGGVGHGGAHPDSTTTRLSSGKPLRLGQRSSWFASGGDLSGLLAPALMPVGVWGFPRRETMAASGWPRGRSESASAPRATSDLPVGLGFGL
jgi:hypothetical protein